MVFATIHFLHLKQRQISHELIVPKTSANKFYSVTGLELIEYKIEYKLIIYKHSSSSFMSMPYMYNFE